MLPNQLNKVLELAVGNTTDSASSENRRPLTDEDKQFLSNAMESMCPDYVKVLKTCCTILDDREKSNHDQRVASFSELLNHCDNLDIAQDFEKLGGFRILKDYLLRLSPSANDDVLKEGILALDVLSLCCQLNEYCQEKAFQHEILHRAEALLAESLLSLTAQTKVTPLPLKCVVNSFKVALKSLSVISAIVRGSEQSIGLFLHVVKGKLVDEASAMTSLAGLIQALCFGEVKLSGEELDDADKALPRRLRTKAAFLLRSLINKEESAVVGTNTISPCEAAIKVFLESGAVQKLVEIITSSSPEAEATSYEHVLSLLAWTLENSQSARKHLPAQLMTALKSKVSVWKSTAEDDGEEDLVKNCEIVLRSIN